MNNLILTHALRPVTAEDVACVADTVAKQSTNGDMQLSILMRTLIALCKTLGIPQFVLVRHIDQAWETTRPMFDRPVIGRKVQ